MDRNSYTKTTLHSLSYLDPGP